jgi:hypothetical protein
MGKRYVTIAQKLKEESTSTIAEIQGSQLVEFSRSIKNTLKPVSFLKLIIILEDQRNHYHPKKWFHTYKRFRGEFESFEDFIQWYNKRPHEL